MLRLMSVQGLAVLLVAITLTACGNGSTPSLGDPVPVKDKLLAAADAAAKNHGGKAKHVEAVETTRGKAADLTGHSNQDQSEKVWVVEVSGDHYGCGACRIPAGASPPRGAYITMVLRASDLVSTDGGLGPRATDLSALGDVQVLRDER